MQKILDNARKQLNESRKQSRHRLIMLRRAIELKRTSMLSRDSSDLTATISSLPEQPLLPTHRYPTRSRGPIDPEHSSDRQLR